MQVKTTTAYHFFNIKKNKGYFNSWMKAIIMPCTGNQVSSLHLGFVKQQQKARVSLFFVVFGH